MKFKAEGKNICLHNKEELYHGTLYQKATLVLAELKTNTKPSFGWWEYQK